MNRLEVVNLTKKYGEKYALRNFSFSITDGEIVGLLGKSNAGKTTLLNCIAGNIFPDSGELVFNGNNLLRNAKDRKAIGILIEASFVDYLTAYENFQALLYAAGKTNSGQNRATIEETLSSVDLYNYSEKFVESFPLGVKQKLGFAQTLLNGRKMLILDEPFAGLDAGSRTIVKEKIRNIVETYNIGVLLSEHTLDDVRDICNRIVCIENGQKVYDGIISDETIYYITVSEIYPEMTACLDEYGVQIHQDSKVIQVIGNEKLSEVLRLVVGFTTVKKIENTQDSLSRFLREGS